MMIPPRKSQTYSYYRHVQPEICWSVGLSALKSTLDTLNLQPAMIGSSGVHYTDLTSVSENIMTHNPPFRETCDLEPRFSNLGNFSATPVSQ